MALLVAEGFDDLSSSGFSSHLLNKVYSWSGASIGVFNNAGTRTAGRYGGYGKQSPTSGTLGLQWNLPSNLTEIYLALAVVRVSTAVAGQSILQLREGSNIQLQIRMSEADSNLLEVRRGTTLLGAYSTAYFPVSVWRWLSIRLVVHGSAGIVEVKDGLGNELINLTAQDTVEGSNVWVDNVTMQSVNNNAIGIDDLLIMDTTGSTFNGHKTERAIRTVFPSADGSTLDWAANTGDRWAAVDDPEPDDDTTYIASGTPAEVNLSAIGNLTGNETGIEGLIVQHRTRKDDVGARTARGLVRTGGSNFAGETITLDSSYAHFADLWEQNPDTVAAWSQAEIDAGEIGVEVVA